MMPSRGLKPGNSAPFAAKVVGPERRERVDLDLRRFVVASRP
jgi:hypothetical protein